MFSLSVIFIFISDFCGFLIVSTFFFSFSFWVWLKILDGRASRVCRKWKHGVKRSMGRRENLSFAGRKMDDDSTARLVRYAYSLKGLDMYYSFSVSLILVTLFILYIVLQYQTKLDAIKHIAE